jgi:pimeloyl-ACP methyl ester carboxylesterase
MPNTVLLLPGLMCDAAVWAPQVQALSGQARCEVVRYGLLDSLSAMAEHVLATAPTERFSLAGELVIIEQCGHMCTMEQSLAVNVALSRWLRN